MANKENRSPMVCDTTGTITLLDKKVKNIIVNPSAANHVVVLQDTAGNEIFRSLSSVAESKPYPINTTFHGMKAITLTNITNILIYTSEV